MMRHPEISLFGRIRHLLGLLVVLAVAMEDFRFEQRLRVTHSHPYEQGASHFHAEFAGLCAGDVEAPLEEGGRDPNRHTHIIEVGGEMPITAPEGSVVVLPPHSENHGVPLPSELFAPSRADEGLLRPPRLG